MLNQTISPMLAKNSNTVPVNSADYAYEIKWDGIRSIFYCRNGCLSILSRNNKDLTKQYPELRGLAERFKQHYLVLDGEIVILTKDGRSSFSLLQNRMGLTSDRVIQAQMQINPATYIIFDLLFLNNQSLLNYPYHERRTILESLNLNGPNWQTPPYKTGQGRMILAATGKLKLEGIIAKRLDSIYQPGKRSEAWLKIKNQKRQEFIIGGWIPGKGKRFDTIGALLVGYYDVTPQQAGVRGIPQQLIYAGAVGTGFSNDMLKMLAKALAKLESPTNPFASVPPKNNPKFLIPQLVAEFEFTEWTPNHTLRHPSFKGLRNDKDPKLVIRES